LLTLREERRVRVFENRVLRRIFGPKKDEVTGEWRKLHNEELNDLYCSSDIVRVIKSRRMRWAGHVAHMGEENGRRPAPEAAYTLSVKMSDFIVTSYLKEKLSKLRSFDSQ